jgi:hypothetical protein
VYTCMRSLFRSLPVLAPALAEYSLRADHARNNTRAPPIVTPEPSRYVPSYGTDRAKSILRSGMWGDRIDHVMGTGGAMLFRRAGNSCLGNVALRRAMLTEAHSISSLGFSIVLASSRGKE